MGSNSMQGDMGRFPKTYGKIFLVLRAIRRDARSLLLNMGEEAHSPHCYCQGTAKGKPCLE